EVLRKRGTQVDKEATQAALDRHVDTLRPKITEQLRQEALAVLEGEIAQTEDQLLIAREQEKMLAKVVADLTEEAKAVGQETLKMSGRAREGAEEEKIAASVADKIRTLQMHPLAPPRAKPLNEAVVSSTGDSKKKLLAAGGGGVGTLALMMLAVG